MSLIERFEPATLQAVARELDLNCYVDRDGDVLAIFNGEDTGAPVQVHFTAEGPGRSVFVVRVAGSGYVRPDDWPRLQGLINRWQVDNRWPRVSLVELPSGRNAALECDGQLDVSAGVFLPLLVGFAANVIGTAFAFFASVRTESILAEFDFDDLDQLELDLGSDPGVLGP